jgi:hypothetical protein
VIETTFAIRCPGQDTVALRRRPEDEPDNEECSRESPCPERRPKGIEVGSSGVWGLVTKPGETGGKPEAKLTRRMRPRIKPSKAANGSHDSRKKAERDNDVPPL